MNNYRIMRKILTLKNSGVVRALQKAKYKRIQNNSADVILLNSLHSDVYNKCLKYSHQH